MLNTAYMHADLTDCTITRLWTECESLRSAVWRFPHGAFCLCVFKNNHQLTAPFRPPSISSLLPSRPFIWQPHLFPLCWLIASLFPFSRKRERKRERDGRKRGIQRNARFCWYFSHWWWWRKIKMWRSDIGRVDLSGTFHKILVHGCRNLLLIGYWLLPQEH